MNFAAPAKFREHLPGSRMRASLIFVDYFADPADRRAVKILEKARQKVGEWMGKPIFEAILSPIGDQISCHCLESRQIQRRPMDERLRQLQWTLRDLDWIRLNSWQAKLDPSLPLSAAILCTLRHFQAHYDESEGAGLVQVCLLIDGNFFVEHFHDIEQRRTKGNDFEHLLTEYSLILAIEEEKADSLTFVNNNFKRKTTNKRRNILVLLFGKDYHRISSLYQMTFPFPPSFHSLEDISQLNSSRPTGQLLKRAHSKSESALESPSSTTDESSISPPPETSALLCTLQTAAATWKKCELMVEKCGMADSEDSAEARGLLVKGKKKVLRFNDEPGKGQIEEKEAAVDFCEQFRRNRLKFEPFLEPSGDDARMDRSMGVVNERKARWVEEMLSRRDQQQSSAMPPMPPHIVHCCRCSGGRVHCCCCIRQMGAVANPHPSACSCCQREGRAKATIARQTDEEERIEKGGVLLVYRKYKLGQPESCV